VLTTIPSGVTLLKNYKENLLTGKLGSYTPEVLFSYPEREQDQESLLAVI